MCRLFNMYSTCVLKSKLTNLILYAILQYLLWMNYPRIFLRSRFTQIYSTSQWGRKGYYNFLCTLTLNSLCVCVYREIRNVELLKLRFGESHMHYCEVMLKVCFPFRSLLLLVIRHLVIMICDLNGIYFHYVCYLYWTCLSSSAGCSRLSAHQH